MALPLNAINCTLATFNEIKTIYPNLISLLRVLLVNQS